MKAPCGYCKRTVRVLSGYLKTHKRPGGTPCEGSGRAPGSKP